MTTQINTDKDLLGFLVMQASSNQKNWFGFKEQRLTGINLAHQIAARHANTMTPEECVDYAIELNNAIYNKIIKG